MPDNDLWYCGPWTLWVMAGRGVASGAGVWRGERVATPLAVAITAAGLVSGARIGPGAAAKRDPQLAQWNEIRSHYQEIAEWIDHDTATAHPAVAATQISAAGSFGRANMVDYLGLLDSRADETVRRDEFSRWLSAKPDYLVTTEQSVDAATIALPEFRHAYDRAATIGTLNVYRRNSPDGDEPLPADGN